MSDQEVLVLEASHSSFNATVILNSYKFPVLVEFMGIWSEPCTHMAEDLAKLAAEFAGQFAFVKVDSDEQQELMQEYDIKNLPTLKMFKDGEVILTNEGQLSSAELRDLLKAQGIYRQSDELRKQAREKHIAGDMIGAITLLTQAIQQDPGNTRVAMDMVQIFLDVNEIEQATSLFNKLPDRDKQSETGKMLIGQLTIKKLAAKTEGLDALMARIESNPDDYDACFDLSLCFVAEHNYSQAMHYLFKIFDKEPEYKEGAAKEMIINLTNILMPNEPEMAKEFRRRLGNVMN